MKVVRQKTRVTGIVPARLILCGLAIAVLGVAFGADARGETAPNRPNYARFWQEKIKPAEGEVFLHSTYKPRVSLSPKVAAKVREVMNSELKKSMRAGKVTLDRKKKLALTTQATYGYTRSLLQPEALKAFSNRAVEGFKEFLEYVGRPDLLPKIEFRLLDEQTKFESPVKESAIMYLAGHRKIRIWAYLHYQGQKEILLRRKIVVTDSVRGQLVGVFTGSFTEEQGVNLRPVMHHAYGGVGYSAMSSYAIPMSELFPICLRQMAAARVNKEINAAWAQRGKPNSFKTREYQSIIRKWDIREDSVVEALIDEFIGSKLDELGFTREDWVKYCKHGNNPQYALSPAIKEKIKKLGAPEVLRMYIEEPDRLFN